MITLKIISPQRLRDTVKQPQCLKKPELKTVPLCPCGKFFILLLCLAVLGLVSCETTQVVHHTAPALPPEIQKAQDDVYDLENQMYQAQHDLTIAKINEKEQELQNQRNVNPAFVGQYTEMVSKLEMQRARAENRWGLAQQWYSAVQNGDLDSAKSIQEQMNQP
jgi:hypothetical protein